MRIVRVMFALLVTSLVGCASSVPLTIPLTKSQVGKIRTAGAVISTPQKAFGVDYRRSNITGLTGGGALVYLIDAMINSSRENAAAATVAPALTGLQTYSFEEELRKAVQAEMSKVEWFEFRDVRLSTETFDTDARKLVNGTDADGLLVIFASATFSTSFDTFTVRASMDMLPRTVNAKPGIDADFTVNTPLYRDKAEYVLAAPGAGTDQAQNVAIWAKDDSKLLKQALDESVRKIATDLATRLSDAPAAAR